MTHRQSISASYSRAALSIVMLLAAIGMQAQGFLKIEKDSVPLFRGFAVAFDLVGAAQLQLSDYGQYEGALRLNLHNQYFPTVEVGLGKAQHENDLITGITYKTSAPYFRLGCDVNMLKRKHTGNRVYAGLRYGFTHYKATIAVPGYADPTWGWPTHYGVTDEPCYQHWAEVVFGIDAKVAGPLHMGWSVRYKRRFMHDDGKTDNVWYVPGYGTQGTTKLGVAFQVAIDL